MWDWFSWGIIVSLLLIVLGIWLIFNHIKISKGNETFSDNSSISDTRSEQSHEIKVLRRSVKDKRIAGVCGGFAEYLDIDSNIIRLIYMLIILGSFGLGVFLYIILALIMPQGKQN